MNGEAGVPQQTKFGPSRRSFLTFAGTAVAGGLAGGFAASAIDRLHLELKPSTRASSLSSTRSHADLLAESIFVHDYSDGSGSAANDDGAIASAFAAANMTKWDKPVVFTRPFKVLTEHSVPFGAVIQGIDENTILQPQTLIRSVFNVRGGHSTIRNLTCAFPSYPSTNAYRSDFVRVEKPWDNFPVRLEKLTATSARNIIRWVDGDMPQIDGVYGINNIRALHFENNGMNGRITNLFQLGGGGIYLGRNTDAARPQQMEGSTFSDLKFQPADLGAERAASPAGLEIHAGLALRFYDLLIDQIRHSGGVLLDATSYPIDDIEFYGVWLGGGEGIAAGTSGLTATGAATRLHIFGGKIVGFPRWGAFFDKTGRFLLDGVEMKLNGTNGISDSGDLLSSGGRGTVRSCDFNSTTRTVYEADGSLVYGDDNYFTASAIPVAVTRATNWARSSGPGAPT
jgi:hypothetical protein